MEVVGDDLYCPEVGKWAEEKHSLVSYYAKLFSTGMKDKWDERVYIELYAGAGYSKIRETDRTIAGSPIQALLLPNSFDKYIFCDADPKSLEALQLRVERTAPNAHVEYVLGNCNVRVKEILAQIPSYSKNHRVLSLCFVDPWDIGIKFETLRQLSERYVDFLVLLALHMDAARNHENYVREETVKIDEFLGANDWRGRWKSARVAGTKFPGFLAEEFSHSMESLQYRPQPFYKMRKVMFPDKNYPLYRLALFSRSSVAYSFWDEVLKYSTDQLSLGGDSWR